MQARRSRIQGRCLLRPGGRLLELVGASPQVAEGHSAGLDLLSLSHGLDAACRDHTFIAASTCHGFTLEVSDPVRVLLATEGFDPIYGARPLRRVIQNRLQNALANALLGGEFQPGASIRVNEQHGELTFDAG